MAHTAKKVTAARFNDYIYDPLFVVSGEKDFYKAAVTAQLSAAKFAVCPVFPSMFSDLPHQPRTQVVMRRGDPIPDYKPLETVSFVTAKPVDIDGVDRHKFFAAPVKPKEIIPPLELQTPPPTPTTATRARKHVVYFGKHSKKIQTQYRESSAQTSPWQPGYIVMDCDDPELLMLDFLEWGKGLPAGMHEVRLIERARMKRAWEKTLPPVIDEATLEKRRQVIDAVERDAWAFREQEIEDIHDLRMNLLIEMLNELLDKSKTRIQQKMKNLCAMKEKEKEEKIKKLRHKTERELRKLQLRQSGYNPKYHQVSVIDEHVDKKSELYGPLMRHGENPKRWHQVIDEHAKKYRAHYLGVEDISTLPRWLDDATRIRESELQLPGTRLCVRETKWTTQVLKQLHSELQNLRRHDRPSRVCTLMVKIYKEPSEIMTPTLGEGDDYEEEIHQAAIFIQRVLRGRASQMLIYEGRDRCKELIQELRSTHALQEEDRKKKFYQRLEVKSQQRENAICRKNLSKLQDTLSRLSGTVVGTLLDFLNKELRRLLEERRIHAMCLLFERERHRREAAEAGRRQKEIRRGLEHDEIFKQVIKVNQDTVDLYLQDIITEGMEFTSEEEARRYVDIMAEKIDEATQDSEKTATFHEKEELIANMVHNFLLPEVEKQIVRDKIKHKQQNYLKAVHESIYNKVEDLPNPYEKGRRRETQAGSDDSHNRRLSAPPGYLVDILERVVARKDVENVHLPEVASYQYDSLNLVYQKKSGYFEAPLSVTNSILQLFDNQSTLSIRQEARLSLFENDTPSSPPVPKKD